MTRGVRTRRVKLGALSLAAAGLVLALPAAGEAKTKLTGVVWTDSDRDGIRDTGEPGRGGVRVELLRARKRNADPTIVRSAETDGGGDWSAAIKGRGFYRARALLPGSVEGFAAPNQGGDDQVDSDVADSGAQLGTTPTVKLKPGKRSRRFDAGLLAIKAPGPPGATIAIGDFVWADADGDGIQDPSESGLGEIAIELWDPTKTTRLATTASNSAGFWALPATAGTSYRIRVLEGTRLITPKSAGADRALDSEINSVGADAGFSDTFTLPESSPDLDLGLITAAVGDRVWDDVNSNGVQDPAEPGIPGVQIQLWNPAITNLITTATTDASGNYRLIVDTPGSYRVRVLLPSGSTGYSPKGVGDDATNSDINTTAPNLGFTDVLSLTGGFTATVDAGIL